MYTVYVLLQIVMFCQLSCTCTVFCVFCPEGLLYMYRTKKNCVCVLCVLCVLCTCTYMYTCIVCVFCEWLCVCVCPWVCVYTYVLCVLCAVLAVCVFCVVFAVFSTYCYNINCTCRFCVFFPLSDSTISTVMHRFSSEHRS